MRAKAGRCATDQAQVAVGCVEGLSMSFLIEVEVDTKS